jgi:predicted nucleotidyltransferase
MAYTLDDIRAKVKPIAEKYNIPAVYVFGSIARGDAAEGSDVDLAMSYRGSKIQGLFSEVGLFNDLEDAFGKDNVDLFSMDGKDIPQYRERNEALVRNIENEMVRVYGE